MAQTLEELVLRLSADSRQLKRELRVVSQKNEQAAGKMRRVWLKANEGVKAYVGGLFRLKGALGAAALAASFALIAKSVAGSSKRMLDFVDTIDKAAGKLGISTDALQRWRFAADQSGVAATTFDMALQRFTRRAAEAANDTGEAKDAIKELGIELRDSDGQLRTTEALFSDAMDALARIDEPAERLRLAFKLFDSEGAKLVQMADRFGELTRKADELGLVIEASVIRQGVEAKDRLAALGQVTNALVAPALVDFSEVLIDVAKALREVAEFVSVVWSAFKDLEDLSERQTRRLVARLEGEVETLREMMRVRYEELDRAGTSFERLNAIINGYVAKIEELNAELAEARDHLESFADEDRNVPGLLPSVEEINASTEALIGWHDTFDRVQESAKKKADGIEQAWSGLQGDLSDGFAQLVVDGEASFKAIGKAFLREVVATIVRSQVLGTLMSFFGGIGAGATAGGNYTGPFSSIINPPAVGSGVLLPGSGVYAPGRIPGRAAGGPVVAGRPYLVGERGPELIRPRSPGTVVPTAGLGGGANVSVVIHNYSGEDVSTSDSESTPSMREIEVFIGEASSKSVLRGGELSQAIGSRFGLKPVGRRGS